MLAMAGVSPTCPRDALVEIATDKEAGMTYIAHKADRMAVEGPAETVIGKGHNHQSVSAPDSGQEQEADQGWCDPSATAICFSRHIWDSA